MARVRRKPNTERPVTVWLLCESDLGEYFELDLSGWPEVPARGDRVSFTDHGRELEILVEPTALFDVDRREILLRGRVSAR